MKKSKLLQSSKDMLSRSFNPAKCKTSLRLAVSRLKLMRNKKDAQVKQMKREISQLLESGQDRTARIRVDHVVREEKMMAAYDLLEIYCELIVSRLPIIESQKNVPIDLKEAIASVVFASPRCGDVPELLDIRKHLTAKYGKDFTTAAIELRPDSGVARMLVEKLSAVAPDGQTKLKILGAIAEEHNVKWDPNSFTEKDSVPPSDLLNGPSNFVKTSTLHAEPPPVQAPPVQFTPSNLLQDPRASPGPENPSFQNSGISTFQPTARPLGEDKANLSQEDRFRSSLGRHSWNMGFKDAASAARAAAESAEHASMAARAAAELSNREKLMRQSSSESHNSYGRVLKDEGRETCVTPKSTSKQVLENSVDISSSDENRRVQNVIQPSNEKKSRSFKECLIAPKRTVMDPNQFKEKGLSGISKKQSSLSSDDGLQDTEISRERKQERTGSAKKFDLGKSAAHQPETRPEEFGIDSDELDDKYSPEIEGLNFGKLTGGFRQKGYNRPPYLKNPQGGRSLSKKEAQEANASTIKSTFASADESPKIRTMLSSRKSGRAPVMSHSDTDSDSSEEEESLPMSPGHSKARFAPRAGGQVKSKTGLKASNSVFGLDNSDLDEDVPKEAHTKKSHLRSGISRRTKAPPSGSKPVSYVKMHRAETETSDSEGDSPLEFDSQRKKSQGWENYERPSSAKVDSVPAKSSLWASPQQPPSENLAHVALHESKPQLKTGDERKHVYKQRKESKALGYDPNEEPSPSTSNANEAPPQFEPKMNSKEGESYKHPAPGKETIKPDKVSLWAPPEQYKADSKPNYLDKLETPEQPNPGKSTSAGPRKSKTSEQPSSAQTKTEASVSSENPKGSTLNNGKSSNGDKPLKAVHVHPKLPDYDSLVQALRKNRP